MRKARARKRALSWTAVARAALVAVFVAGAVDEAGSEKVVLTTYYPAPAGVYTKILTTNDTLLARDGGAVSVGATDGPQLKLSVRGAVRVGNLDSDPDPAATGDGSIYYNRATQTFRGLQGGAWQELGGGVGDVLPAPGLCTVPSDPNPATLCSDFRENVWAKNQDLGAHAFCALSYFMKDSTNMAWCWVDQDPSTSIWTLHLRKDVGTSAGIACSAVCLK